jgi:hypothetical protein
VGLVRFEKRARVGMAAGVNSGIDLGLDSQSSGAALKKPLSCICSEKLLRFKG